MFETAAKVLDYTPDIVTVRPAGLDDIFQNIQTIGEAAGVADRAIALVYDLKQRVARVREEITNLQRRPRVFCLDWLSPLRNTGQWVPELVELAGGSEGLAAKWGKSRAIAWQEIVDYQPEYLMVMPCAFAPERAGLEARRRLPILPGWSKLPAVQDNRVYLFDGRVPSRHGPRVIDVMEGLAEAMYPDRFPNLAPPGLFEQVVLTPD